MSERTKGYLWIAVGIGLPIVVAVALVPAREWLGTANVALVLMVVVVGIAASGNRGAASLAAVSSAALAFDYLHTEPYGSFSITKREDTLTFVCLLVVGVAVAQVATWGRRQRSTAERTVTDVTILRSVAELAASGEDPEYLVISAAYWLRELLDLRDCRFEYELAPTDRATLTADGEIKIGEVLWDVDSVGMPDMEIELLVRGEGRPLARFVLSPTPLARVAADRMLTAVSIADQVGVCLAGHHQPNP